MTDQDTLAPLLKLAESAAKAKEITADAETRLNAAKMAQIHANETQKAADERAVALDKAETEHTGRVKELEAAQTRLADAQAKLYAANLALDAREKEVAANETRIAGALERAAKAEAQAKSYEGAAYAKLENTRKALATAEAL